MMSSSPSLSPVTGLEAGIISDLGEAVQFAGPTQVSECGNQGEGIEMPRARRPLTEKYSPAKMSG